MKLTVTLLFFGLSFSLLFAAEDKDLMKKAKELQRRILTIDTHTDTPLNLLRSNFDLAEDHTGREKAGRLDFPRMKRGGLDAVFFAVYIGQGPRTAEGHKTAKNKALQIFETIHKALKKNTDLAEPALTPADALRLQTLGKRAVYIGMENGYPLGRDISLLQRFYDLGARYITLCHSSNNDICDSSTDSGGPEYNGLSPFGEQVVREMNRLGMIIDVSHISDSSFYDVLRLSRAPVMASHSAARALCDHPRNLNDDMLKLLAEKGGVIQVVLMSDYLKNIEQSPERAEGMKKVRAMYQKFDQLTAQEQQQVRELRWQLDEKYPKKLATVSDLVDHIDHIVQVAGIDHVGIGSDFDGGGGLEDCRDVSELPNITLELLKRGYSEQDIAKIWAGNFMRVFKQVIATSSVRHARDEQ